MAIGPHTFAYHLVIVFQIWPIAAIVTTKN